VIVADTNLIVYLHLPGPLSDLADQVQELDPEWVAPELWRYEFRNVLVTCMRTGRLDLPVALAIVARAERQVGSPGCSASSRSVLELAQASGRTAYDCEFVALAQLLNVPLVTSDRRILTSFPDTAVAMDRFVSRPSGLGSGGPRA
jgi:predicted nucleic acid-binding protein